MRKLILLTAFVFVSMVSYGQFRVALGLVGGIPMGNFGDNVDAGGGGYVEAKGSFGNLEVGGHLGGLIFGGASVGGSSVDVNATTIVPVLAIGHYFFDVPGVNLYAGAGLGPYFVKFGDVDLGGTSGTIDGGSDTKFGFAPKVGINLGGVDIGVAYHVVSDLSFLGINLGFHIGKRAGA